MERDEQTKMQTEKYIDIQSKYTDRKERKFAERHKNNTFIWVSEWQNRIALNVIIFSTEV